LEEFIRLANTRAKEAILLGFLEHALQDSRIDNFFAVWEQDETLAPLLAEGRKLAKGFRELTR
jgi:hypothetical protein